MSGSNKRLRQLLVYKIHTWNTVQTPEKSEKIGLVNRTSESGKRLFTLLLLLLLLLLLMMMMMMMMFLSLAVS